MLASYTSFVSFISFVPFLGVPLSNQVGSRIRPIDVVPSARETLGPTPKEQSRINQVDSALPTTTFLCLLSRPSGTVPSCTTTDIEPETSFLEPLFVHVMQPPASETRYHYDTQRTLSHRPEVDMNSIAPYSMGISES